MKPYTQKQFTTAIGGNGFYLAIGIITSTIVIYAIIEVVKQFVK